MRSPARTRSGEAPIWMSHSVRCCVIAADRYSASTRRSHSDRTASVAGTGGTRGRRVIVIASHDSAARSGQGPPSPPPASGGGGLHDEIVTCHVRVFWSQAAITGGQPVPSRYLHSTGYSSAHVAHDWPLWGIAAGHRARYGCWRCHLPFEHV